MLLDLNGKPIQHVEESANLKEEAEKALINIITDIETKVSAIINDYKELNDFSTAIAMPVNDFLNRTAMLKKIIKVGVVETDFLGITQQDDYNDMRKDLLKEMMFFIETRKNNNDPI